MRRNFAAQASWDGLLFDELAALEPDVADEPPANGGQYDAELAEPLAGS
ncbi:hypothetical protein [Streptomyces mirabilis]|nr:hypothetical protein [Streptomyces mirabilis]MCX4427068.1 hypothetical protein [Streptomyces mirabilis]